MMSASIKEARHEHQRIDAMTVIWRRDDLAATVLGLAATFFAVDDRVVGLRYQFVDQRRRRFAAFEVRLYGSNGNLREHEHGTLELRRASSTECPACKAGQAGLEALRLIAHAAFEIRRPISLHEIMAAIEQQQSRIVQMQTRPGRRVKRGGESVPGFDGRHKTRLIGKYGLQPQLSKQRVARSEAVIERTFWRAQALRHRINRHGARAAFRSQCPSRSQEARIIE
jgi:hypothetical protein